MSFDGFDDFKFALECSPLHLLPVTNTTHTTPDIILNTEDHYVGTKVTVTCPEGYHVVGESLLQCLSTGEWNVNALPHCSDVLYGVPESVILYIVVFAICAVLCVLVFAVIIAKIICYKETHSSDSDPLAQPGSESGCSMPYTLDKNQESLRYVSQQQVVPIAMNQGLDPQQAIELYVNETFHEYDQEQWRNRMSSYDSFESDYESQWRESVTTDPDPNRKYSQESTGTIPTFDDERYIPVQEEEVLETLEDDQTPF